MTRGDVPNPRARRRQGRFRSLPPGQDVGHPPLPERRPDRLRYLVATRRAWAAWWASPMATEWDATADLPSLLLAALCFDDAQRGSHKAATEFRMWADRLGLHAAARARLRVELPSPEQRDTVATVVQLRPDPDRQTTHHHQEDDDA